MTTVGVRRRAISYITAGGLAVAGGLVLANAGAAQAQVMRNGDKVWVCKYVGKPGVDERLQSGANPVEVGWRSADKDNDGQVSVGDQFADAQGRSTVIQINGTDPGIQACPPAIGPTATTTPTKTTTTTAPATTSTTPSTPRTSTTTPSRRTTTPSTTTSPTTSARTTTAPPATSTSTPSTTTTPGTTTGTTTPSTTSTTSRAAHLGPGRTPGPDAPGTGGAGGVNPVNGLVGSGLLLAAAGVLANETLRRRPSGDA